jgi:hypothetical protein
MSRVGRLPRVNPFSTRFVEPGALPFRFPTTDCLDTLVGRLEETGGWGQLIGPHGSGKSTLLATLLPALRAWRRRGVVLNTTNRKLPSWVWKPLPKRCLLVIDGYEQLGFVTRWRLQRHCRQHGAGLLITAHRSLGLPTLYRTEVTVATATAVIASLIPSEGAWVLADFDIAARLRHHRGNLRELLFELYDRWNAGARLGEPYPGG